MGKVIREAFPDVVVLLERLERMLEYGLIRAGAQSVKQFSKTIRTLSFNTQQMRGGVEMKWGWRRTGEHVRGGRRTHDDLNKNCSDWYFPAPVKT